MRVTCVGHSGFVVESECATLVFDYYTDEHSVLLPILERARRIYVFVSHSHRDHLNHDIFAWRYRYPIARYVVANECRRKLGRSLQLQDYPFVFMHHDEDYVDEQLAVHAFNSTDVGVCYMVDINGQRVFHAGDYNCWHFEQERSEREVKKAVGDFNVILQAIKSYTQHVDLAMFPVIPNIGGDFAMGARLFLRAIATSHFVPMHTWGRDREATQFDLYPSPHNTHYHALSPGHHLTL